jgi:hypothetical protein
MMECSVKWCLICKTEDQKIDLSPEVVLVQKEELGKYLGFKMLERKGFLSVTIFQAV